MTKRKFERMFSLLSRGVMTSLLALSLYILGTVAEMRCDPDIFLRLGGAVIPAVEAVLAAIAVYPAFALVAARIRWE